MALPEAVASGLVRAGEMAAAVAASVLALKFALWKFKLMRQEIALERMVADSVEVQETGFPARSSELWASPDQMIQHCARCGGEPVFDPGMMDWTCPTCGAANEGGQDLDPNDPDNYESAEGLRGGFDIENSESGPDDDDYDNGYSVVAPERCHCGNTTFEKDHLGVLRCTWCDDRVQETFQGHADGALTALAVVSDGAADDDGDGFGVCRSCGRAMDQMAVDVGMCNHCGTFIDPADEGKGPYPPGYELPSMSLVECEECGVQFDPTTSPSRKLCGDCFDKYKDDDD